MPCTLHQHQPPPPPIPPHPHLASPNSTRTAQHSMAQHRTAPHRTAPRRTAQHSTAQHSSTAAAAQHSTAQQLSSTASATCSRCVCVRTHARSGAAQRRAQQQSDFGQQRAADEHQTSSTAQQQPTCSAYKHVGNAVGSVRVAAVVSQCAVRPGSSRAKRRAAAAAVATQCGVRSNNQNSSPAAAERDSSACRAGVCCGYAIICNHLVCVRARAHSMLQNAKYCVCEAKLTSVNHYLHLTTGKPVEAAAAAVPRTVHCDASLECIKHKD